MIEKRLSQTELAALLADAGTKVQVGGRYRHYKRLEYIVLAVALLEATNMPAVVYQAEYGEKVQFIRPLDDWLALVEVDGAMMPRFERVA